MNIIVYTVYRCNKTYVADYFVLHGKKKIR